MREQHGDDDDDSPLSSYDTHGDEDTLANYKEPDKENKKSFFDTLYSFFVFLIQAR